MGLLTNLISYWKLDEASGTRADSHGSSHLTDNNTVIGGTGIIGTGASMVAANLEWLSVADNAGLSTGNVDFSFQVWVKLDTKTANQVLLCKWHPVGGFEYFLFYELATDRFRFYIGGAFDNVIANNLGSPSVGVWYCIHCWQDVTNNQIGISVNAGTPDLLTRTSNATDTTSDFVLGRNDNNGEYLNGTVDEAAFWKKVLTGPDRTQLYNGGAGWPYTSFDVVAAPVQAVYRPVRALQIGPMALRFGKRSAAPPDLRQAPVVDYNFGGRVRVPHNRVGPMALRRSFRSPAYPYDTTIRTSNRRRRAICAGA